MGAVQDVIMLYSKQYCTGFHLPRIQAGTHFRQERSNGPLRLHRLNQDFIQNSDSASSYTMMVYGAFLDFVLSIATVVTLGSGNYPSRREAN